jgi:hypothetical protein
MRVAPAPRVRPRHVLLLGAHVVGWSVGRAGAGAVSTATEPVPGQPLEPSTPLAPVARTPRTQRLRKPVRLVLAGAGTAVVLAGAGLVLRPAVARAPLVDRAVAAREHAQAAKQAEAARLKLLRHLELAGIAARRVGPAEHLQRRATPLRSAAPPSDRAIALDTYLEALGSGTILVGLDASRERLQQQVLSDSRLSIYPDGRGDVASGKLDVRILALMEYLAQADGEVTVSGLISGHAQYVPGRPGVISPHFAGRAVDISVVGGVPILDHQGPGTVTEHTIRQILALPASVEPVQVISLMTLGGPSFALPDHYNHIHVGY